MGWLLLSSSNIESNSSVKSASMLPMSFNTSLVPVNRNKSGIDKQALNLAAKAKLNANAKEFSKRG